MPRFENDILGLIPQTDWLNVGFDVTRQNDPVDRLLGDLRTDNLVAEWESIASEYQIPSIAQFHSFDVESQTTVRVPIDAHNVEKGLIKVKINQSERLRALLGRGVQNNAALYNRVLDDGINLAEQVFTRSKVAKNELMATGKVTIKENNLNLTVDYGVPAANTNLTLDFTEATKDIPSQIQEIIDAALAKGVIITGMYTSSKNLTKLRQNETIQKLLNGNAAVGAMVRMESLRAYLEEEFGIREIVTNDLVYAMPRTIDRTTNRPTTVTKRYFPQNKITFYGTNISATLGTGLWGNPPEMDSIDLQGANSAEFPYVYVSQWQEKDPAVIWTKASALFMPVLYNPNSLYIATVQD